MKPYINSSAKATHINFKVEDLETAIVTAKERGDNQVSLSLFFRTGAGAENLQSVTGLATALKKEKLFVTCADITTRNYTPAGDGGKAV